MYPTLYHLFLDLFGYAPKFLQIIPMFGFWVGVAFIVASWLGGRELKRRERLGFIKPTKKTVTIGKPASIMDLTMNGIYGFFIGFKLTPIFYQPNIFNDFPGYILSGEGNVIAGILVGAGLLYWRYRESGKEKLETPITKEIDVHAHEHMGNITLMAVAGGIGGAVIFATLEKPELIGEYLGKPSLGISHLYNGLTVYGGVIIAIIMCSYYFIKNKLNVAQFLDALGPTVLLAYGIGRIGCQMSGDGDWGIDNLAPKPEWMAMLPDWMWAYDYPNNINGEGIPIAQEVCKFEPKYCFRLENPVFPTPIYETLMSFSLFAIIWNLRKKITTPMIMFSLYILVTGLERLLIERIRVNTEYESGFTQAEEISVGMIILGIFGLIFFYRRWKNKQNALN